MRKTTTRVGRVAPADAVRSHLDSLGITEKDVADAVFWARSHDQSVRSTKGTEEIEVPERHIELEQIVEDVASALANLDSSGEPFKKFQPGVGPYGEPQLVRAVASYVNKLATYRELAKTKRTPDLLMTGEWALEFKIARPFGDNSKEAENWSVNLLHPYEGNVSVIGDCLKLQRFAGTERKAVVVAGYEHTPPRIPLSPLFDAFTCVAT